MDKIDDPHIMKKKRIFSGGGPIVRNKSVIEPPVDGYPIVAAVISAGTSISSDRKNLHSLYHHKKRKKIHIPQSTAIIRENVTRKRVTKHTKRNRHKNSHNHHYHHNNSLFEYLVFLSPTT